MFAVAIGGPAGAGKSSVAKAAAKELGFVYVDTGAIYRTIALHVLRQGVDPHDAPAVEALLPHIQVELAELPVLFLVRAQGQGTGRDHHITVTECRVLPKGDPIGGPPAGRNIGGAPAQDFRCQIPRPVVQ